MMSYSDHRISYGNGDRFESLRLRHCFPDVKRQFRERDFVPLLTNFPRGSSGVQIWAHGIAHFGLSAALGFSLLYFLASATA